MRRRPALVTVLLLLSVSLTSAFAGAPDRAASLAQAAAAADLESPYP